MRLLRVITWTLAARVRARHLVQATGLSSLTIPAAPRLGLEHIGKVERVLALSRATCLVRSAVVQRWLADNGERVDLVVGVKPPSQGFRAHAWLDRESERHNTAEFTEITRIPAGDPQA